jgi:hypothetical protein
MMSKPSTGRMCRTVLCSAFLIGTAGGVSLYAQAQEETPENVPPPRVGNVWEGLSHQPTESEVEGALQQQGLELPPNQQRRLNTEVEDLARQLLQQEQTDPEIAGQMKKYEGQR